MYSCIVALVDDVYKSVFSVPHESTDQSSNLSEYSGKQTIHDNLYFSCILVDQKGKPS